MRVYHRSGGRGDSLRIFDLNANGRGHRAALGLVGGLTRADVHRVAQRLGASRRRSQQRRSRTAIGQNRSAIGLRRGNRG